MSSPESRVVSTHSLQHLPVTLFSSVMGIEGLSIAWRNASATWGISQWPSEILLWMGLGVFVVVATLYCAKWVQYPSAARAEIAHPIRMVFLPTITISLLLIATAGHHQLGDAAAPLWWLGAVGHFCLTVYIVSAWFAREDITLTHVTPAWFIPIVGNIITPLAAHRLGSMELAWFSFSVGLVFWIGFMPIILRRLLLHNPSIPQKLLPTLAIFLAPPSIGMVSWQALTGAQADPVSRILLSAGLAFACVLAAQLGSLWRVPFALPYWAYTFPLAALTSASLVFARQVTAIGYDIIAVVLLAVTTIIVCVVSAGTVRLAVQRKICVAD